MKLSKHSEVWNLAAIRQKRWQETQRDDGCNLGDCSTLKDILLLLFTAHTHTHKQAQTVINRLRHIYSHKYPKVSTTLLISINDYYASQTGPKIKLACHLSLSLVQYLSDVSFPLPTIRGTHSDLPSFPSPPAGYELFNSVISLFLSLFLSLSLPPTSGPLQSKWSDQSKVGAVSEIILRQSPIWNDLSRQQTSSRETERKRDTIKCSICDSWLQALPTPCLLLRTPSRSNYSSCSELCPCHPVSLHRVNVEC